MSYVIALGFLTLLVAHLAVARFRPRAEVLTAVSPAIPQVAPQAALPDPAIAARLLVMLTRRTAMGKEFAVAILDRGQWHFWVAPNTDAGEAWMLFHVGYSTQRAEAPLSQEAAERVVATIADNRELRRRVRQQVEG
jgi:hypothetical protein